MRKLFHSAFCEFFEFITVNRCLKIFYRFPLSNIDQVKASAWRKSSVKSCRYEARLLLHVLRCLLPHFQGCLFLPFGNFKWINQNYIRHSFLSSIVANELSSSCSPVLRKQFPIKRSEPGVEKVVVVAEAEVYPLLVAELTTCGDLGECFEVRLARRAG